MATKRLADVAIDRSRSYERKRRAREKELLKRAPDEEHYSRTLEIAINLYNYIQDTPGMSRALLAEKLHVSQAYLCKLINGKLNPSIKTIEKYERILSVKLLPVTANTERTPVISCLPVFKMFTSAFFKDNGKESNTYAGYADQFQILTY